MSSFTLPLHQDLFTTMLEKSFTELAQKYTDDQETISITWKEIEKNHSHLDRHYHTLEHLKNLLSQLTDVKDKIRQWDAVMFALYFHDVVYNVLKHKNEEKSAEFAKKRMGVLKVPPDTIGQTCKLILATKKHLVKEDTDINYFTDADLSILGAEPGIYATYCLQIRKEYSVYPDIVYKPGRKKVVEHFLEMENIFKTEYFFEKFEQQAKENLNEELQLLKGA